MGARPSSFKGGGGFLKDVDVTFLEYTFTDEFNGVAFVPGKKADGKPKFHSLFAVLKFLVDGATEAITQTFFVGNADDWDISEDGKTLIPHTDGQELGKSAAFAKFVATMCHPIEEPEKGFDEELLPADDFNFEPLENQRIRVGQETLIDRKTGKAKVRKVTKGKFAGKEFEDTTTVVTRYYGPADEQDAPAPPAKGKAAAAAKSTKSTKPAAEPDEEDPKDLASATIVAILGDNEGTILKPKLRMAIIGKLGAKHPQREDVLKLAADDTFLKSIEGVTYKIKSQTLTKDEDDE